jgi:phage terminase large subunit
VRRYLEIESQGPLKDPLSEIAEMLGECTDDPDAFNELFLRGPSFWGRQRELCRSVVDYRVTVAYSGNMIGKDFWVGRLIWWWLYTRTQDPLVVVTGPSQSLLGLVTWKEVRRAISNAIIPASAKITSGAKTSPQQLDLGNGIQAVGYSTTSVERASGQHSGELLVIVEEASGVDDEIWEAIDSLGYDRLVCIGNPIRADGRFVDLIRQADRDRADGIPPHKAVNAIQIPSTDSPHAAWDKSPIGLADKTWIDEQTRRYGKDSLWVRSHIKAEIPVVSADTLIPEAWLDFAAAQPGRCAADHDPVSGTRRISCDLGEGVGRDSSCILVRDDRGILEVVSGAHLGLAEAANRIFHLSQKYSVPPTRISYDRVGIGRDFHLHLKRMGLGDALGYAGAAKPLSGDFVNLRTEAAWKLRSRLNPEGVADQRQPYATRAPFAIPPADWWPRMREELKALTYSLVGKRTALLSKEDHCTVLGHSPDTSDALIQSFAW